MFVSPCSYRSARCAALIALTAVAGVSRFELNSAAAVPGSVGTRPGATAGAVRAYLVSMVATMHRVVVTQFSPADAPAAVCPAPEMPTDGRPSLSSEVTSPTPHPPVSEAFPPNPRHVIPWAVGPPAPQDAFARCFSA